MEGAVLQLEDCINYLLTNAQHKVYQLMSARLAPYGITPGQYGVLNCLWSKREDTPKDVAQTLGLETSTISGLLDKMQKRGLIDRVVNPGDRRVIHIVLTPEGETLREPVLAIVRQVNDEILGEFTPEASAAFLSTLRVVISRF